MAHIGEEFNYDDNFIRMITIGLIKVFGTKIRWINKYQDSKIRVIVPFYAWIGQERFALDAFVDDIPDKRVELDTTQKQRGLVIFRGCSTRDDEFANPNQYLSKTTKINNQLKSVVSRTKGVPISLNYDIQIKLDNELEADTCIAKIINVMFNYRFFNFSYFGMKIDAFFKLPPEKGIDIPRESNLTSVNDPMIKFNLEVQTYYPIFQIDTDDCEICDNDDLIDWNFLGVEKPSLNNNNCNGLKRVIWYNNLVDNKTKEELIKEKERDKNLDSDILE